MKKHALVIMFIGFSFLSSSQPLFKGEALESGYYIVVSAYRVSQEKHMIDYSEKLNRGGLHSNHGYDVSRKFYYVYLDFYEDFNESIQEMLLTRKKAGFEEAWVRIIKNNAKSEVSVSKEDLHQDQEGVKKEDQPVVVQAKAEVEKQLITEKDQVVIKSEEKRKEEAPPADEARFMLYLFNPANDQAIDGEVEIIDAERATFLKKEKSNEVVTISYPKTKSGTVSMVGSSFGYRKVQHDLSLRQLNDSLPGFVEQKRDHYLIKFDLTRLRKGDIETLYNVFFFNDAAVMIPESRYELDKLLDMLKSNPRYRIRLHGHTNGNGRGKLILMGPGKRFFELSSDVVNTSGSAKELSLQRAITIKEWLVSNQIAADRIETIGWGGNRMLQEKDSDKARRNVRVEVEVLDE